ncbi:replication-relaxation family protein [Fictibacillus phosphorivorans]|uniref:replication-relaxation family protein n=1 Tax=Fictibacillus phosphorivorans TaxID=1221500 RepID=UPI003CF69164
MKVNKHRFAIEKSQNRKRLQYGEAELLLWVYLLKERALTEKQLYQYYSMYDTISYPGFWKKLCKFEEYGLIKSYKYRVGQNGTIIKYFRIRSLCYELLKKFDLITEEYENINVSTIPKSNLDHHFGTKEVILKSLIELRNTLDNYHTVYPSKLTRVYPITIPDGVLMSDDKLLYIEFDSGSETLNELKSKIQRYLHEADNSISKKEGILITLLDNSIPNRKGIDDRRNRIKNLINIISSLPEILTKSVPIYILPLSIAQKASLTFFKETSESRDEKVKTVASTLYETDIHTSFKYEEVDKIYTNYMQHYGLLPDHIELHNLDQYKNFFTFFQFKELGNIQDHKKIIQLLEVPCLSQGFTPEILYVVYEDEDSMHQDVHITGALKRVRYITANLPENYSDKPYVFVRDTKTKVKKVFDLALWPTLF